MGTMAKKEYGEILSAKELFVFDMDGTIYLGSQVFDFAVRFINHLREDGRRVLFFTNNASHSTDFYYAKLSALGFSPQEGEIMTSGDVTIQFLRRHRPGKKVYLVGTDDLIRQFQNMGIALIPDDGNPMDGTPDTSADIVITSFDTTVDYGKLNRACRLIRGGAEYFSTHPDFNCPTETGFLPDSGAIAAFVTASTGKVPTYFGKPYPETIDMICETTGVRKADICIFGDRLYTDIALGKHHGVTAALVLTGETDFNAVVQAAEADRPDLVLTSLEEADHLMFPV